ncbi:MAG: pseudouridine synthase [Huintestinicola sp.]
MSENEHLQRADKFIAGQTGMSRSEVKDMIKHRKILLNGTPLTSPETKIMPGRDDISIGGKHILYRQYMYIMLNKPAGVVCATKDRLTETVLSLIPEELRRRDLFPAGRLDKNTEGFVFITDDGALAHKMLSPKSHVEKEYVVTLERPAEKHYKNELERGLTIDGDEICLPAQIIYTDDEHIVNLILHEGKYHQVKRMMEALGNKVTALKRIRIGGIDLDPGLAPGECREILHKEIASLYTK